MIQSTATYEPRSDLSNDVHAEPSYIREPSSGDFARGQRTGRHHTRACGDFATGMRSSSVRTATGTFATGMCTSSTPTAVGDFATGMRTVPPVSLGLDSVSERSSLPIAA
jgi:hypothetical protein